MSAKTTSQPKPPEGAAFALLVDLLSHDRPRIDQALLCLAALDGSAKVAAIRATGVAAGVRAMKAWNVSAYLGSASTLVRLLGGSWQLTSSGWAHVASLGFSQQTSSILVQTDAVLTASIAKLTDADRRLFVEEAHRCFGTGSMRAAVVLAWVGAAWILQQEVINKTLVAFNAAGNSRYNKTKFVFAPIKTIEDFGRLKEADLLQLLEDIGTVGKSLHKQLRERLDLRNAAGHPNSITIDAHTAAAHLHFLCLNVYDKF